MSSCVGRINVLLSRAKHGMYIIGNTKTSGGIPMWAEVINILKEGDNVDKTLGLCCPRHPWVSIEVATPEDFQRFSPEGGCDLQCDRHLKCGHKCGTKCHSDIRHDSKQFPSLKLLLRTNCVDLDVRCLQPCERPKSGCEHVCKKYCGDKCDKRCEETLLDVNLVLPCGHIIKDLKCWQFQAQESIECMVTVR